MYDYEVWDTRLDVELPIEVLTPAWASEHLEDPGDADDGHVLVIGDSDALAYAILGTPAGLFAFRDRLDAELRRAFPAGPVTLAIGERGYEGHVTDADGRRVSLQCWKGRHGECPDTTPGGGSGPLDGFRCECPGCGCGTGNR